MTTRQKIELRLSKVRERLNTIAGLEGEDFDEAARDEAHELSVEYGDLEVRYRAAVLAESEQEQAAAALFDGETSDGAELRAILGRVNLGDYLGPAAGGSGISGAARELNEALELPLAGPSGGVAVPWRVLVDAGPLEARAFTTTGANDGPEMQRPILQRLFGPGVLDMLGVRVDAVPVGRTEWPLVTSGVAPTQKKETTAADAPVTAGFSFANLKPKRLTGAYEWTHEAAASVPGIEAALRRDLRDAIRSKMSDTILNGAEPDGSNPERIEGFISELTVTDDTAIATAARYGQLPSEAVDGLHATSEGEVDVLIGVATYKHAAATYLAGSGEAGSELLFRRARSVMASSYIPAVASMKQYAILHAGGANGGTARGDSVAAMWPTVEVIRDPYTKASQGVVLTWIALWDAVVAFRAAAYALRGIQVTT